MQTNEFLPVSRADLDRLGIEQLDFLYISGDAYVDHPSFGHAIITRVLADMGFAVGIIAQPNWKTDEDFLKLGAPKYGILISSGNIDSMVNHYTAAKKPRSEDLYSPGGKAGLRPDRAVTVYAKKARALFPGIPVVIGGIEASLRRFSHYDYWSDSVRPSVLYESGADLLIYGMGERQIREIARHLQYGKDPSKIRDVKGTCFLVENETDLPGGTTLIASHAEVASDKKKYAQAFMTQRENQDPITGKRLCQRQPEGILVQNPPAKPLSTKELDSVYALPYTRRPHPMYDAAGGVPAISEVEFSITAHRGCFGGCSFCALTYHQGRMVTARSDESILEEARLLTTLPGFKGYIHDVGGPTANFHAPSCQKQQTNGTCAKRQCMYPAPCKNMKVSHEGYLALLRKIREIPGVKKVFIRSGIRFDYLMADPDDTFFRELVQHHVSGQLKVAPEHISAAVLKRMGKPSHGVYRAFSDKFFRLCKRYGKEQYLVPYLMSSHPGSTLSEAIELAVYLKEHHLAPQQVQDFYPTPSTLSTCMYYTGIDPRDGSHVYTAKTAQSKAMQRALLQFRDPKNYETVRAALIKASRQDLIGNGPHCLIRPRPGEVPVDGMGERLGGKQPGRNHPTAHRTMSKGRRADGHVGKAKGQNQNRGKPGFQPPRGDAKPRGRKGK